MGGGTGEQSSVIRERVIRARERQHARLGDHRTNAKMNPRELRETIQLDQESQDFMRLVMGRMNISGRVFDRILKVGRTIADLSGEDAVRKAHIAEAVQYRERGNG